MDSPIETPPPQLQILLTLDQSGRLNVTAPMETVEQKLTSVKLMLAAMQLVIEYRPRGGLVLPNGPLPPSDLTRPPFMG